MAYKNKEDRNAYMREYRRQRRVDDPAFAERERTQWQRADEKRRDDPERKAKKARYARENQRK